MVSCNNDPHPNQYDSPIFNSVVELDFINAISEDSLNVFDFHYLYNGGGVGILDFNNDGLKDIFLGGNMVSAKAFLNKGDMVFEDITDDIGLVTDSWINGISVIDINHDGYQDIYLSVGGPECDKTSCNNLLYIHNGDPTKPFYTEKAQAYKLNLSQYSQQALFADFDKDGDLDLYQLQNYVDHTTKNYPKPKNYYSPKSTDLLMINMEVETGEIKFEDHSEKWNVNIPGFGLGIALCDINEDGYPDVYVANDFITDDIFYINQGGKHFSDHSRKLLKHTSYNSMGVDIADINSDQRDDIVVVDMLPSKNSRQKTMLGSMNIDKYKLSLTEGYNSQFIRNTLQLNNGIDPTTNTSLPFSEVGAYYKIHESDWSWSPLIADFDNDGISDLFISNGYGKNITDLDFVNYTSNTTGFGSKAKAIDHLKSQIKNLPSVKLSNRLYLNVSDKVPGLDIGEPNITNGVAYADLDNDGDLDLVLNNINQNSHILVNDSNPKHNHFTVKLNGPSLNPTAIGSKLSLTLLDGQQITKYVSPVRSYMSTMDSRLFFGLGTNSPASLKVLWPDGSLSQIELESNSSNLDIDYKTSAKVKKQTPSTVFSNYSGPEEILDSGVSDNALNDFDLQALLLKPCNIKKPHATIHNDELLITKGDSIYLKVQRGDKWHTTKAKKVDSGHITHMAIGKWKNDIENAIYVTSYNQSLLAETKVELIVLDFDNDFKELARWPLPVGIYSLELFNHVLHDEPIVALAKYPSARHYPIAKGNSLLFYDLSGNDITLNLGLELGSACITDIDIIDINGDNTEDIFITSEWNHPIILTQDKVSGKLNKLAAGLEQYTGLWQSALIEDIDKDGDLDIFLSNFGTNNRYFASKQNPLKIAIEDLDGNGDIDPLIGVFNPSENKYYPYHTRDDLSKTLSLIKKHFNSYSDFGNASFDDLLNIFGNNQKQLYASTTESILLKNSGNFTFEKVELPKEVQYSIVNHVSSLDFDLDGDTDFLLSSNLDNMETHNGRLDALNTLVLIQKDSMVFKSLTSREHGLNLPSPNYQSLTTDSSDLIISSADGVHFFKKNDL